MDNLFPLAFVTLLVVITFLWLTGYFEDAFKNLFSGINKAVRCTLARPKKEGKDLKTFAKA